MRVLSSLLIIFATMLVSVALSGCGLSIVLDERTTEVGNFTEFLKAIAARDDAQARTYLSQTAQSALSAGCPGGSAVGCFDRMGMQHWGKLKEVYWVYGISAGESCYTTLWDGDAIDIIVRSHQAGGRWQIDGWRGGISSKVGWTKELLNGTDPINQFPASP